MSKEAVDLLAEHAVFLQKELDLPDAWWLCQRPLPLQTLQTVLPLLWLARRVQAALTPVSPEPAFRQELRQQLIDADFETRPWRRGLWVGAAVVGGVVSLTGLSWWLRQRSTEEGASLGRALL